MLRREHLDGHGALLVNVACAQVHLQRRVGCGGDGHGRGDGRVVDRAHLYGHGPAVVQRAVADPVGERERSRCLGSGGEGPLAAIPGNCGTLPRQDRLAGGEGARQLGALEVEYRRNPGDQGVLVGGDAHVFRDRLLVRPPAPGVGDKLGGGAALPRVEPQARVRQGRERQVVGAVTPHEPPQRDLDPGPGRYRSGDCEHAARLRRGRIVRADSDQPPTRLRTSNPAASAPEAWTRSESDRGVSVPMSVTLKRR